jgi:biotin operon repressor
MTAEPADLSEETSEIKKPKRLTTEQWAEIENHWAYGTKSSKELSEEFGITPAAIRMHFKKLMDEGVPIARNSKRHLLAGKTAAAVTGKVAETAAGTIIGAFASKRRERIEQTKTTIFNQSQINQVTLMNLQKKIADPASALAGITPATYAEDFKVIQRIEATLGMMIKNRWTILDVENDIDEATLPILSFEDLTAAEIIKAQMGEEEEDDDIDLPEEVEVDEDEEIIETGKGAPEL